MSTTTPSAAAIPSSSKPSPTTNVKPNRLPAPTLFVGPPSGNASHLSVSRQQTNEPRAGGAGKSALGRNVETTGAAGNDVKLPPPPNNIKKASEKSIEAKWKDMQSTLNEVEFTAQSSTHIFGESHAKALDDLRRAQVELARAWGRGMNESEDEGGKIDAGGESFRGAQDLVDERREVGRGTGRERSDTNSTALSDESLRSDVTSKSGSGRSQLEDETKMDILLASERRANNEAYFKKVEGGVREVVKKLEFVAEAMKGVEGESRSLWSESSGTATMMTDMGGGESEAGVRKASEG